MKQIFVKKFYMSSHYKDLAKKNKSKIWKRF